MCGWVGACASERVRVWMGGEEAGAGHLCEGEGMGWRGKRGQVVNIWGGKGGTGSKHVHGAGEGETGDCVCGGGEGGGMW